MSVARIRGLGEMTLIKVLVDSNIAVFCYPPLAQIYEQTDLDV